MKKYLYFLSLLFFAHLLPAQELERQVISSAGGNLESGDLSLVSTVGEFATETHDGNFFDLFIAQGFHQESLFSVGTYDFDSGIAIEVFPNPCSEFVYLSSDVDEPLQIEIIDLLGRTMATQQLLAPISKATISMAEFASGQYFLKVLNTSGELVYIFTLQKINQ